jgi:PAS domain S-box-containing protein
MGETLMNDQSKTKHTRIQKKASLDLEYAESIFNTVSQSLIILDQDLRVVTANRSFYEVFKVKPEETMGQLIYDLGNKQWDIPKLRELLETILPQKTTSDNYEVEHDFATIGRRTMLLNARQIKRALGKERIIILAIEDITERMRIERSLAENEAHLRTLVQTIPDLIWLKDADGIYLDCNTMFERFFGAKKADIAGKTDYDFVDKELADFFRENDRKAMAAGKPSSNEEWITFADDGHRALLDTIKTPMFNVEGKLIGVLGIARDITERKREEEDLYLSEERFRLLSEASFEAIAIHEEGILLNANDQYFKMFGYEPSEALGKEMISLTFAPEVLEFVKKQVSTGSLGPYESIGLRKDGTRFPVEIRARKMEYKGRIVRFGAVRDITERKRAEEALREREKSLASIYNTVGDVIFHLAVEPAGQFRFVSVNSAFSKVTGLSSEMVVGRTVNEIIPEPSLTMVLEKYQQAIAENTIMRWEEISDYPSGRLIGVVSIAPVFDDKGTCTHLVGSVHDITERKRAEEALRESKQRYRNIFDSVLDAMFLLEVTEDDHFRNLEINPAMEKSSGIPRDKVIGRLIEEIVPEETAGTINARYRQCVEAGHPIEQDAVLDLPLGSRYYHTTLIPIRNSNGRIYRILGISRDVTERKQYEESLHNASLYTRSLIEASLDPLVTINQEGKITDVNKATEIITGISRGQLVGSDFTEYFTEPEKARAGYQQVLSEGLVRDYPLTIKRISGNEIDVLYNATIYKNETGQVQGVFAAARDITERKRAEEELHRLNRELRAISSCNQVLVRAQNEQDLLNDICRIICDEAGYRMVWVGYVEYDDEKTVRPVAWGGFDDGYVANAKLTWADDAKRAQGPGGTAIRSGKTVYIEDFTTDPRMTPWRESALQRGYRSTIALPLKDENANVFGVLLIYSMEINAFTPYEIRILEELTNDLAFGITTLRTQVKRKQAEEQLHQTLDRLKKAVGTTIQVLGTASEARDPYTAGHQKRVADLARTIATEMDLSTNTIEGIRMAGSIHDIGKLSIPAEILSKPTKLTDLEFSLIKEHPRSGYEMLKDVESPWPLAEIVYQHHERMNGSGYPRNLKGDDILIEARIMAVADVVEAMASHRPYRPGLGIEAALEEIEKNKGILYDNDVVDVCLRLFREKGFQLT